VNYESWQRDPHGIEEPHDVLAADEFGIGTRDERLPPNPSRFDPPHDILAAEEFAMPAVGEPNGHPGDPAKGRSPLALVGLLVLAAIAAFVVIRRR
jgi:MYXO-CTERM domain-containing protein